MNTAAARRQPYPGLRPFRREETDLFFGREDCVDQLIDLLAREHFLAVLGSSGSGKSSLVKTGLLEGLDLGLMATAGSRWRVANFRPGDEPLHRLARALLRNEGHSAQDEIGDEDVNMLRAFLNRGPRSIIEWCNDGHLAPRENLLLLVDQFEELFRYESYAGREEAQAFVALLLESSQPNSSVPIYVVLTMRSEFLGACALIEGLAERMNAGQYLTPRMTREQCRAAIEGPAAVCGFSVEPALVNWLLNELQNFAPWEEAGSMTSQLDRLARRADQLPLLQHALNRMWEHAIGATDAAEEEKGIVLRLADFEAMGGLQGALERHANHILAELGNERRSFAEAVFRALTEGSAAADAIRRPTMFRDLVAIAGGDDKDLRANTERGVRDVIEAFRARGRNFLLPETDVILPETWIDISHESVIRQWPQLSKWLQAEADDARQWRRLIDASGLEREGKGDLLQALTLENFLAWRNGAKPTRVWAERYGAKFDEASSFLDRSAKAEAEQREIKRQRQRWKLNAIAVLALCFSLFAAFAGWQWHRAEERTASAKKARAIAIDTLNVSVLEIAQVESVYGIPPDKIGFKPVFNQKILDEAISNFGRLIELDPRDADARVGRGNTYGIKGEYSRAINDYNEAIDIDPANADAFANRGNTYLKEAGNGAFYLKETGNGPFSGTVVLVPFLISISRAIEDFNEAIRLAPTYTAAYSNRGNAYYLMKDYDRAIADYDKAIDLDRKYAIAYKGRADAYADKAESEDASVSDADFNRALADYAEAISLEPKYVYAYYNRGNLYHSKGDNDKAIADYSKALGLYPSWFNLYMNRAVAYAAKAESKETVENADLDSAIADYTEAIRLDPQFAYTYKNRGQAYTDKGDAGRAILDFDEAIRLDPRFAEAYRVRGFAHVDEGDFDAALADYTTAIAIELRNVYGYRQRARAYFVQGNFTAAAADFLFSIEFVDNPGPAWDMLWLYLARGRAGENATAELETNAARLKDKHWPYPVMEFYLGQRSATEVLSAAKNSEQRCDAQLYIGEWHLDHGDRARAAVALQAVLDGCPKTNWGYLTAKVELKRLGQ